MADKLSRLRNLAKKLPPGLSSDWKYTNHFELTCQGKEYFWLMVRDSGGDALFDNTIGKRFGLLMDIAEEVCRLKDAGLLGDQ